MVKRLPQVIALQELTSKITFMRFRTYRASLLF